MAKPIALERFTQSLFALLDETFEHVHGNYLDKGDSLFETLRHVSADQASRAASNQVATIAAQVKHVRFYLSVLQDEMMNKTVEHVDWGEVWRTTKQVTPEEWETIKQELEETYQSVVTTLKNLDGWDGENDIADALSVLAHTAYHLGEIRQALGVIR